MNLPIAKWQQYSDEYSAWLKANPPAKKYEHGHCFRIDGTILSTARFYGAFNLNGVHYTCFSPSDMPEAVLAVSPDFNLWLADRLNPKKKRRVKQAEPELFDGIKPKGE